MTCVLLKSFQGTFGFCHAEAAHWPHTGGLRLKHAQDAHAMNEEATHENQEIHKTGSQPNTIHRHIHHKLPDIFWPNRKDAVT